MKIEKHLLTGAKFAPAFYTGGQITPEIVVLHETAGRLKKGNSARYLASKNDAKASVHFVIERDGTITQLVRTNRKANHAGRSAYEGRKGCNGFSIGIELVGPGKLQKEGETGVAWFKQAYPIDGFGLEEVATPHHGAGLWMPFTQEQIEATKGLLKALFKGVKSLRAITTHWEISPGRKVDPNPLFPLDQIRAAVLPDSQPPAAADTLPRSRVDTPGDTLNLRPMPAFGTHVLAKIPHDAIVQVERTQTVNGRKWCAVRYGDQRGWVVENHLNKI